MLFFFFFFFKLNAEIVKNKKKIEEKAWRILFFFFSSALSGTKRRNETFVSGEAAEANSRQLRGTRKQKPRRVVKKTKLKFCFRIAVRVLRNLSLYSVVFC